MATFLDTGVPCVMCMQADPNSIVGFNVTLNSLIFNSRFLYYGGAVPYRPVEDLAFAVARFYQLGGIFMNYYMIRLGRNKNQTSLAQSFMDKVKVHDLEKVLEPLFYCWKQKCESQESFGNFTARILKLCSFLFGLAKVTPFSLSRGLRSLKNMPRNGEV
ncbi:hypothetical protein AHAS_Ahas07G0107200 [Arachis hypogaea]